MSSRRRKRRYARVGKDSQECERSELREVRRVVSKILPSPMRIKRRNIEEFAGQGKIREMSGIII